MCLLFFSPPGSLQCTRLDPCYMCHFTVQSWWPHWIFVQSWWPHWIFVLMRLHLMWHARALTVLHVIWSDGVVTRVMQLTHHCYCNFSAVCCWGADGAAWGGVPPRQHTAHDVLWSHRECSCQHTARWSRQRLNDVKLGPRYSEDGHGQMTLSQTAKFLLRRRAVILASVGLLGLRFCFGETGILDIIKKQDCWSRGNVLQ